MAWEQLFWVVRAGARWGDSSSSGRRCHVNGLLQAQSAGQRLARRERSRPEICLSDAKAKPRSWTCDASISAPLTENSFFRGLLGYRVQRFRFTYTDKLQGEIFDPNRGYFPPEFVFESGPVIEFSHITGTSIWRNRACCSGFGGDFSGSLGARSDEISSDFGFVRADNEDFHILRTPGPRITTESSKGTSWHMNLGVEWRVNDRFGLTLEGDFMRIYTGGRHLLTERAALNLGMAPGCGPSRSTSPSAAP